MGFGTVVATSPKAGELLRQTGLGPQLVTVRNNGLVSAILSMFRQRNGVLSAVITDKHTLRKDVATGYVGNGSTASFTGQSLNPVAPGTLVVEGTTLSPELRDLDKNGILYYAAVGARKAGSGGTFAAMAGESMTVKIDGDKAQTITFGTEATIGAAVTKINSQLKGGFATAAGAQNVHLESRTIGEKSRIEVVTVAAGITTKLGISAGSATAVAGSINYFTGALALAYGGGYKPAAQAGTDTALASVMSTIAGPYKFVHGDTLVINTNAGGNETCTFTAVAAKVDGAGGSFAALAGETFEVRFEDGPVQVITMGTEATIALAVAAINAQLVGGFCSAIDANNIRITSDKKGTGSRVRTSNVAAGIDTKLGLATDEDEIGTGNVADIDAVTVAEIKTVVELGTTGLTVNDVGGKVQLTAATSIAVSATSTAETKVGLATTTATASTGVGSENLKCSYVQAAALAAAKQERYYVPNLSAEDELVLYGVGLAKGTALKVQVDPQRLS